MIHYIDVNRRFADSNSDFFYFTTVYLNMYVYFYFVINFPKLSIRLQTFTNTLLQLFVIMFYKY